MPASSPPCRKRAAPSRTRCAKSSRPPSRSCRGERSSASSPRCTSTRTSRSRRSSSSPTAPCPWTASSAKPRAQQQLDVAAAARRDEPAADTVAVHDHQRRHLVDAEAVHELGVLFHLDPVYPERVVVPAPLEHLGEVAVDAPRLPRALGVEDDEPREDGGAEGLGAHSAAPVGFAPRT